MNPLVPLVVAVPLLAAPTIGGLGHWLPRRVDDIAGILVAAATTALAVIVLGVAYFAWARLRSTRLARGRASDTPH